METNTTGRTPADITRFGKVGALTRERNKLLKNAERFRRYDNGDADAARIEAQADELNRQIARLRERHNAA
jgi:hypothetical protein